MGIKRHFFFQYEHFLIITAGTRRLKKLQLQRKNFSDILLYIQHQGFFQMGNTGGRVLLLNCWNVLQVPNIHSEGDPELNRTLVEG